MYCETHRQLECDSCRDTDDHTSATARSINPDWSGYDLCGECAAKYDAECVAKPASALTAEALSPIAALEGQIAELSKRIAELERQVAALKGSFG
jgi:hypothetical protein